MLQDELRAHYNDICKLRDIVESLDSQVVYNLDPVSEDRPDEDMTITEAKFNAFWQEFEARAPQRVIDHVLEIPDFPHHSPVDMGKFRGDLHTFCHVDMRGLNGEQLMHWRDSLSKIVHELKPVQSQ